MNYIEKVRRRRVRMRRCRLESTLDFRRGGRCELGRWGVDARRLLIRTQFSKSFRLLLGQARSRKVCSTKCLLQVTRHGRVHHIHLCHGNAPYSVLTGHHLARANRKEPRVFRTLGEHVCDGVRDEWNRSDWQMCKFRFLHGSWKEMGR